VRTLLRCQVEGRSREEILLWVEGDAFLRQMVRIIVGTLLEVGRGRRAARSMAALLAVRDRRRAGPTAPARGLTLVQVSY
jgi:tRNA pseudouridine38-40 synthase